MEDAESEEAFFAEFEKMFFGGGMGGSAFFEEFDEFTSFLEQDDKMFRKIFRDLGGGYRNRGKRRKQEKKGRVKGGGGGDGIEEMLNFFMMPGMGMGMGMSFNMEGGSKKKKKQQAKKKKEEEEDDGWGTEEEELDMED